MDDSRPAAAFSPARTSRCRSRARSRSSPRARRPRSRSPAGRSRSGARAARRARPRFRSHSWSRARRRTVTTWSCGTRTRKGSGASASQARAPISAAPAQASQPSRRPGIASVWIRFNGGNLRDWQLMTATTHTEDAEAAPLHRTGCRAAVAARAGRCDAETVASRTQQGKRSCCSAPTVPPSSSTPSR